MYFVFMIDIEKELNGTYKLLTHGQDLMEVELQPSGAWSYFLGHFPQMPILPAVAFVDISQFFVQIWRQGPVSLQGMKYFRIKNPVQPGDKILIHVQPEAPGTFNVLWKSSENEKIFADISLQVSENLNR